MQALVRSVPARRPGPVSRAAAGAALAVLVLAVSSVVHADGSAPLPLPVDTGCFGIDSYGIAMFDTGAGSVTLSPPGPILGVYLHWAGVEDDTPPGVGTSTLTVNGVAVDGTLSAGPACCTDRFDWFSWWANIGPDDGPFGGLGLVDDAALDVVVSGWDNADAATNGATVTVIYDTGPCLVPRRIEIETGADYYFHGFAGDEMSELLVFEFPAAPLDRVVSFHVGHGGTEHDQPTCRGGAVWMKAGAGPAPPATDDLAALGGGGRRFGIDGGVEVVNDPFTNAAMPCVPALNPPPDEPYEPGHPCPAGGAGCPYRALGMTPVDGGHVGAEWGVVELLVLVPAGSEWVAFQLESEADQEGESGTWAGSSFVFAPLPICGDGVLDPGEECDDGNTEDGDGCSAECTLEDVEPGPPVITCLPCERCNDPGACWADIDCADVAAVCDPDGDPIAVACEPVGPYDVGTTEVVVTASDGETEVVEVCEVSVRDCEPPTCDPPAELLLECSTPCGVPADDPAIVAFLGDVGGSDNCGVVSSDDFAPPLFASGCAPGTTTTVGFWTTDAEGLEKTCGAGVTVTDTLPPVAVCPPPATIECSVPGGTPSSDPAIGLWAAAATAEDLCGDASIAAELPDLLPAGCDPGETTEVPFTAVDDCGNAAATTCPVTVVDTLPPVVEGCLLEPAAASAPGSPCSLGATTEVVVECGDAEDACGSEPLATTADLLVTLWEVIDGVCVETTDSYPVECGETLRLELLAPPCPAGPVSSAPPAPTDPGAIGGHRFELVVTTEDACGNTGICSSVTLPCLCAPRPECDEPLCGEAVLPEDWRAAAPSGSRRRPSD